MPPPGPFSSGASTMHASVVDRSEATDDASISEVLMTCAERTMEKSQKVHLIRSEEGNHVLTFSGSRIPLATMSLNSPLEAS